MKPSEHLLVIATLCVPVFTMKVTPAIQNGIEDTKEKYPYIVSLVDQTYDHETKYLVRSCTGTAINDQWIVTAAHCINNALVSAQYGDMKRTPKKKELKARVLKGINHPDYIKENQEAKNDIGLLHVEAMKMKKFGQLSSEDYTSSFGLNVTYVGFGRYKVKDNLTDLLDRPVLNVKGMITRCSEKLLGETAGKFICVSFSPNATDVQHALPGDSGGPLFYDGKVIGVLNQWVRNRRSQAIYTPVSRYWLWIHEMIYSSDVTHYAKKMNVHLRSHMY